MFDKLKQLWQYIKENNVGPEIKERFLKLVRWYKANVAPVSAHEKALQKIWMVAGYKKPWFDPLVRPANEAPVSDGNGVQAELNRKYKKDPSSFGNPNMALEMERKIDERKDELNELARPQSKFKWNDFLNQY